MNREQLIDAGLNPDEVGVAVVCTTCHHTKKPIGRSAPLGAYYCEPVFHGLPGGCEGYYEDPQPGNLWPGETREEFGYA